jgi:hypothetical protein
MRVVQIYQEFLFFHEELKQLEIINERFFDGLLRKNAYLPAQNDIKSVGYFANLIENVVLVVGFELEVLE